MDTGTAVGGIAEKRPRSEALEVAQKWNPEPKPQVTAHNFSAVGGADGAVSAWVADECDRALGRALLRGDGEQHAGLAQSAKLKELDARGKFDVFQPRRQGNVSRQIART